MTDRDFGLLVRKHRALKNLTLQDLSDKTDISLVSLVKIEKGGSSLLRTKINIVKALGLSDDIIDEISK